MEVGRILITGAARGLGLELVRVFSREGWTVFPLVRDASDADRLKARRPGACHPIIGDVTSDEVGTAIAAALDRHGRRLDVLVNNAGISGRAYRLPDVTPGEVRDLLDVHVLGSLRCARAALPYLEASPRPAIVNISSRMGSMALNASGGLGHLEVSYSYRIAKAAQNMLTVCLRRDLADRGITAFAVHPGKLKTALAAEDADTDPEAAAEKLYDLIRTAGPEPVDGFFDLMTGKTIPW